MVLLSKNKKKGPKVNKDDKKSKNQRNKEIMEAINEVIANDDTPEENKKQLSALMISTAFLENSLGFYDPAYNRTYTSGQWSIDEPFLNQILEKSGFAVDEFGNKTDKLRDNNYNKFLIRAGYDPANPKSMDKFVKDLKNYDPLTGAYMARLKYSLDPKPLPKLTKEDIWQTWYLGYNGKGVGEPGSEDYEKLFETFDGFYDDFFDEEYFEDNGDSDPQGMAPGFIENSNDIFSPGSLI